MSHLFEIYQTNLKMLFRKISNNLDTIQKDTEDKLSELEEDLNEVEKIIKNLEIELTGESPISDSYLIFQNQKSQFVNYKKKYRKEKEKYDSNIKKVELELNSSSLLNKNLKNEEIAYKSFNKLESVRRISIEMDSLGHDVMRDMFDQSETMKGINSKIGNVSNDLSSSTSLILEMQKIQRRNKMIIYLYAGFLIILFLIIAFFRIYPKFRKNDNSNEKDNNFTQVNKTNITGFFE